MENSEGKATEVDRSYAHSTKDLGTFEKLILAIVLGFIFINIILALVGVFIGQ